MEYRNRSRMFPGIFVGLILLLIGGSICLHLFFPMYYGFYPWHPFFFPWGAFIGVRLLFFFALVFFVGRRFFWGRRWAHAGYGYRGYAPGCGGFGDRRGAYGRGAYGDWRGDDRRGAFGESWQQGWYQEYQDGRTPFEKAGSRASDDFIELVSGFGAIERKVSSKNFQGGDVTTIMGQLRVDLREADFVGVVRLKVMQVQGVTVIVVPRDWDVRAADGTEFAVYKDSEVGKVIVDANKVLIIEGTCIRGGIEVRTS